MHIIIWILWQSFKLLHMFLKFFSFRLRELKPILSAAIEAENHLRMLFQHSLWGRGGCHPGTH